MCGRSLDGLIEKLPQVDFCCCGCKLSTGAKIIGWLNFINAVFVEILWVFFIISMVTHTSKVPDEKKEDDAMAVALILGPIIGLVIALAIALAVILLVGVYKNDVRKVRCWLHINLVFFTVGVVLASLGVLLILFVKPVDAIAKLITAAINFGISFYIITVVKSYYTEQMAAFQRVSADHA